MAGAGTGRKRSRGNIEQLASGVLRVRIYAGIDPVTKKAYYLKETIPAGPNAAKEAEKAQTRLLAQVDERRNPRTAATLNQLLDKWLDVHDVEPSTRRGYVTLIENQPRWSRCPRRCGVAGVLTDHHRRCLTRAQALGIHWPAAGYVFSLDPDASTPLIPDTATQRFSRMADRLELGANLHSLRHYSATELIAAGVDIRTVAGRLGHGGGGVTTLRVYAAWVAEVDQRAASTLAGRMPDRPQPAVPRIAMQSAETFNEHESPYEKIAAALRADIMTRRLNYGDVLPSLRNLAEQHGVSFSTAQRAMVLLASEGLVSIDSGRRSRVIVEIASGAGDVNSLLP